MGEFVELSGKLIRESGLRQTTSSLWWRGQSDATWPLIPTLYRSAINSEMERELIRDFKLRSLPFLGPTLPSKNIEWLFLMQHHGAPTRILDWSESPLIALYFCLARFDYENEGAVWALNPWVLNIATTGQQLTPTVSSPTIKDYVIDFDDPSVPRAPKAELPIAVRIEYGFNRAHSQRGAATIHGYRKRPIEGLRSSVATAKMSRTRQQKFLFKIHIDGMRKFDMLKSLYEYGIGADTLFPDLDGLSSALRFRYDHRYLGTKLDRQ
ncbi:MAG: FRG domain-containing protein [Acetobacteraceae bacterium]